MRDSAWNILADNSARFEKFVASVIYVVGRDVTDKITVDEEIRDMLVGIALGLNDCLDGGNLAKLDSMILDFHLDQIEEDEEEDGE